MGATHIEWADHSVNPIRARNKRTGAIGHYCTKVSAGCANCYAETWQRRFGTRVLYTADGADNVELFLDETTLGGVFRRRKPTTYFWFDMTDPFHGLVPVDWLDRCFTVMAATGRHRHLVLTKRPERALEYIRAGNVLPDNVGLGVSAENQQRFDERVQLLRQCPAAMRFVSIEPLLGPVDPGVPCRWCCHPDVFTRPHPRLYQDPGHACGYCSNTGREPARKGLDWVIVGAESGPRRRRCKLEWAYHLVDECSAASVPVFVKQLAIDGRVSHNPAEWPEGLRVQQRPEWFWEDQ